MHIIIYAANKIAKSQVKSDDGCNK